MTSKQIVKPTNNQSSRQENVANSIKNTITQLASFDDYPIRELIKDAENFGSYLKEQKLETNQIRKFLDAINRLKADLADKNNFSEVEPAIVLLKPKLAYAAARQSAAKPLSEVMSAAIDKVHSVEDFERLSQFVESIIAYHKAAGGK